MSGYKRIEHCIGRYIAEHYNNPVEIGVGHNFTAAEYIVSSGIRCRCTDIKPQVPPGGVAFTCDDIFFPGTGNYSGADVIYSVRPAEEMISPMKELARNLNCDLLVYHLGFECYGDGGDLVDCGVILHRYHKKDTGSEKG
ncbi:MAG: UPF0146 family protein [Deltaproteobacteria bacterium]